MTLDPFIEAIAERITEKILARLNTGKQAPQRLLTIEQAAEYLGRSPAATRSLVANGKVPAVRLDGRVQIDIRDLEKLISEAKEAA